ncbi:MAG: MarR family winged helix-turn-helix transcriptional regulator [Candidatus Izemoplasmatales bacterium]
MDGKIFKKLTEEMSSFCRANMKRKQDIPIRSSEMGCLIYIVKNANRHGVLSVELSQYFNIKKSSVSAIVSSLEKKNYIQKVSSEDKRSNPIVPTEKGKKLVQDTFNEYHKLSKKIVDELGEEETHHFIQTLKSVKEIILKEG